MFRHYVIHKLETTCTVEPDYDIWLPLKSGKGSHVLCARDHAHSRSAWAENVANVWLPYTRHVGNTLGGITKA